MIPLPDIEAARNAIGDVVRQTPMKRSTTLSDLTGTDFHLKLENFQRTGSFKVRGAMWKILNLDETSRRQGVVAASAGNHAQGVAFAATHAGIESDVFMPESAAHAKAMATQGYGARIHLGGKDYQEAYERAVAFQKDKGATFVHAFDDPFIMAGQGTLGLEISESLPELGTVLVPIGGGGLISGVASAMKARNPELKVIGVQAEGASTVAPSLQKGAVVPLAEVRTMADGIACRNLGERTFPIIRECVDDVITVTEAQIAAAILFLLERTKVVVEGAGAVALAAAMGHHAKLEGQSCAVVSGGNIDMTLLSRIIQHGLVEESRYLALDTTLPDAPGAIAELLALLGRHRANVLDVRHDRLRADVPLHRTFVSIHLETRGPEHVEALRGALSSAGYSFTMTGA